MAYIPSHNFSDIAVNEVMSLGIKNKSIINAISFTNREDFVPYSMKDYANNDYFIYYSKDRFLHARHTLAIMLSNLKLNKNQKVAVYGTGTGYSSVILAKIFSFVFALEENQDYKDNLIKNIKNFNNISYSNDLQSIKQELDFIFIEAEFKHKEQDIYAKLAKNGMLVYTEKHAGVSFIIVEDKQRNKTKIQELVACPDVAFKENNSFVF